MNGTYGTVKPATINPNEADIYYFYRPSWSTDSPDFTSFKKLNSEDCFSRAKYEVEGSEEGITLPGMYNLRLPMKDFNRKGIYTVYIKPREIKVRIAAVGSLVAFPDVTGIVFRTDDLSEFDISNNQLVGYRVDFIGSDNEISGYKIISSNNYCIPVPQNTNNASESGVRYALSSTYQGLIFCTLTPSASMSFSVGEGIANLTDQEVSIVSTKFNPVTIEIEMVEHDAETISTMLEGDQLRNLDMGTITTFNKDGGIYHQARYGNVVSPDEGKHYDFKISYDEENILYSEEESLDDIKNEI